MLTCAEHVFDKLRDMIMKTFLSIILTALLATPLASIPALAAGVNTP